METMKTPTPEEMQKLIEKAKKDLEEKLAQMTPEERAVAEARAQMLIEQDRKENQALLDRAAKILGESPAKPKPKFCTNCGAPVRGGTFCTECGSPL